MRKPGQGQLDALSNAQTSISYKMEKYKKQNQFILKFRNVVLRIKLC